MSISSSSKIIALSERRKQPKSHAVANHGERESEAEVIDLLSPCERAAAVWESVADRLHRDRHSRAALDLEATLPAIASEVERLKGSARPGS